MKPYEVLVVGGSEYHLKFTTANAVNLEEELKTDLLSGLGKVAELKTLAKYYFAAAKSLNDSISTIDDIYQLFDDYFNGGGNFEELQILIIDVLITSGIMTKENGDHMKSIYESKKKLTVDQMEKIAEVLQKLSD
jgi:hypothetical protein